MLRIDTDKSKAYSVLVLDYRECCCADIFTDGEIKVLFKDTSVVPSKIKKGGQSAKRFSQLRENAIVQWFKKIDEMLNLVQGNVHVGVSPIYQKRFVSYLSAENLKKIRTFQSTEYADLSGIYQFSR